MRASIDRVALFTSWTLPVARSTTTPVSARAASASAVSAPHAAIAASAAFRQRAGLDLSALTEHAVLELPDDPAASASLTNVRHGGIAVPGRPWRTVTTRLSAGLSRSASRVRAGPRPPFRVMPWQEPQSWRTRCVSSVRRPSAGSAAIARPASNAPIAPSAILPASLGEIRIAAVRYTASSARVVRVTLTHLKGAGAPS